MKRFALLLMIFALLLALTGCTRSDTGTHYPTFEEMVKTLNGKGYTVSTIVFDKDSETPGKYLSAFKDDDFIDFYWLDHAEDVVACEASLRHRSTIPPYDQLVSVSGDAKHGNLTFCATTQAMQDAGIRLADVKVQDVKVNVNLD